MEDLKYAISSIIFKGCSRDDLFAAECSCVRSARGALTANFIVRSDYLLIVLNRMASYNLFEIFIFAESYDW